MIALLLLAVAEGDVIFREGFEGPDLSGWDEVRNPGNCALDRDVVASGAQALRIESHLARDTGGSVTKWFLPGEDEVYLRFYVRFSEDSDYIHHFVRLIANRADNRWSGFGHAGERPEGDDRYTTGIEPWGDWGRNEAPGWWHFYSYFHAMEESRDGYFWGNHFEPDPPVAAQRGEWTCVEVMVRANTPGEADGAQALWIDGAEAGRFEGIDWRTDGGLRVNALSMDFYVTDRWATRERNAVWFDDVVVARTYIGP